MTFNPSYPAIDARMDAIWRTATATQRHLLHAPRMFIQRAVAVLHSGRGILEPDGMGLAERVAGVVGLIVSME